MKDKFTEKRLEATLSNIGSKVAEATALSEKVVEAGGKMEQLMIEAQKALSDLYISLDVTQEHNHDT